MSTLKVFSAGVAGKIARDAVERFKAEHEGVEVELKIGGSVAGINEYLAGEKYDVLILADNENIDELMMPEYVDGYFIWGGNEMVVIGEGVTEENWKDVLTDPANTVKHVNPFNDPGGYRAVMAMKLADKVEPGLSEKILGNPSYKGLDRNQYKRPPMEPGKKPPMPPKQEPGTYMIAYKSGAVARGANFATLPAVMNLGSIDHEEDYKSVSFDVDGGKTVAGNVILHAITIPKATENRELAEDFAKVFLANRFMMMGFTPVQRKVGNWTVKLPNMWDAESKYYSLMTLMEINGTNLQLDEMPLEPDMVVLDCGCGPGRVAIQLAKRVKKVIALDSSEGMLNECKKNCAAAGVTNVEFVFADWQETEIGNTIPEVDMVIQSRGGGGPSTLSLLQKAARKYAVTVMWSKGAPNLPASRAKLFKDCYSEAAMEKYPDLRPCRMGPPPGAKPEGKKDNGMLFGGRGPVEMGDKLPMAGPELKEALAKRGIEVHVSTIDEGWDKLFATKEEAYEDLINLTRHPDAVDMEQFKKNVDSFLTEREDGFYFYLPTQTDVAWFKTRD